MHKYFPINKTTQNKHYNLHSHKSAIYFLFSPIIKSETQAFMAALEGTSDDEARLIVVGDQRVGKTCLIARYQENIFSTSFVSTVGMDFIIKTDKIDDKIVNVKIWDTAGQEKFRSLVDSFYVKAKGIILAFDISCKESYDHVSEWNKQIRQKALPGVPILLVGTKSDLASKREVDSTDAERWATSHGMEYFETSSKYGTNVTNAIHAIARKALKFKKENPESSSDDIDFSSHSDEDDGKGGRSSGSQGKRSSKKDKLGNCCK